MKRILSQILLILLVMCIGTLSVFITNVKAVSVAGVNCPAQVNLGEYFSVSLILPSNAYTAEATINVKFADGSTASTKLVYMSGMADFPNATSFKAKVAGNATISVSGIVIGDANGATIESGGSKNATTKVIDNSSSSGSTTTPNSGTTTPSTSDQKPNQTNNTISFTDVNEIVYTTERCNVRKNYSTSSQKITTLAKGASIKRTGTSSAGWSRVEYNGAVCYISSQYLTTTNPNNGNDNSNNTVDNQSLENVEFKTVNEKVYATQNCNLRKSWSTSSEKAGYLNKGNEVTRTGIASNGWSRITYNNQTVYVASRLLTTEKLDETNTVNEIENVVDTNEVVQKTEEEILAEIKDEVGVLPEVGNNIATTSYIIVTIIAFFGVLAGVVYFKGKEI